MYCILNNNAEDNRKTPYCSEIVRLIKYFIKLKFRNIKVFNPIEAENVH